LWRNFAGVRAIGYLISRLNGQTGGIFAALNRRVGSNELLPKTALI
jgi:hypothetical protein